MRMNIALGLVALVAQPLMATNVSEYEMVYPSRFDVSAPLVEMAAGLERPVVVEKNYVNPLWVNPHLSPLDVPNDQDSLLQTLLRPDRAANLTPSPLITVEGGSEQDNRDVLGFSVGVPDPNGDVGFDYYVQWVNLIVSVFDKESGDLAFGPVAGNVFWQDFGGSCETINGGDPIVLFDHLAGRWVMTQLTASFTEGTQCFAVSTTSDPLGSYFRYEFSIAPGALNDYPKVTVWPDGYYISTRDFGAQTLLSAEVVEREKMLVGDPSAGLKKFDLAVADGLGAMQPAHLEGSPPPIGTPNTYVLLWDQEVNGGNFQDGYRLWDFSVDWDTGEASFVELPQAVSSPFDSQCGGFTSCVDQPAGGENPPVLSDFTMYRAQYRDFLSHQSIVVTHTVEAQRGQAGKRWVELRRLGGDWRIHQEGTYAPADSIDRWMGSIAMDRSGNLSVAYSASGESLFPSVRYTSRAPADVLGTLPGGEETLSSGSGVLQSAGRWGDYSSMSVDPEDDCTFWYTGEYVEITGAQSWTTRVGSWRVPSCGNFLPGLALSSIDGDAGNTVTWTVDGATPNGEVRVFCSVQGATDRIEVGATQSDATGRASILRLVPDQAGGNTISCRALDTTTYSVSEERARSF